MTGRPSPPLPGVVASAVLVWATCAMGLVTGPRPWLLVGMVVAATATAGAIVARRGRVTVVALGSALALAGIAAGMLAAARLDAAAAVAVDAGRYRMVARMLSDPARGRYGTVALVRASSSSLPGEVTMLAELDGVDADGSAIERVSAGDLIRIDGFVADAPGSHRGDPYRAVVEADSVEVVSRASGPFFGPGNRLRRLVLDRLEGKQSDAAALLAGFLVGDTDELSARHLDELRQAGLMHFVAVSGSNVAVFLAAWWLVIGPFRTRSTASGRPRDSGARGVRRRHPLGVVGPSCVRDGGGGAGWPDRRAAGRAMASPGGGRDRAAALLRRPRRGRGIPAVRGGDLRGADRDADGAPRRRPRWLWSALAVSCGAQLAVLPIALAHFGTVPLLSPLANLLAAPLVAAATVLGGAGAVTGLDILLDSGSVAAGGVLRVASTAAGWPQLDGVGVLAVAGVGGSVAAAGRLRPVLAAGIAAALIAWGMPAPTFARPAVVFLDVGQGDAILIRHPPDTVVLVDGGPDPVVLEAALRRHDIEAIDLLVISHGHADHIAGLAGLFAGHLVGAVWYPAAQPIAGPIHDLLADAVAAEVPVAAVGAGDEAVFGGLRLEVIGPGRRYAGENDGSVVMNVSAGGVDVLLTGDVEAIAQAELPDLHPEVLKVPHHGSATSDLDWLAATVGAIAVISVGENSFGHPDADVLGALTGSGATVLTTRRHGDVVVPLCPCSGPP